MNKVLGKIRSVKIGFGGYDDVQFGIRFSLGGEGYGVQDFWGFWGHNAPSGAKWNEESRRKHFGETFYKIWELMKKAKVQDANKLEGIPIEITFNNGMLVSWKVLEEVL